MTSLSSPTNVVILDLETTGLLPATDRIVELGAILFSIKHATVISSFSTLIAGDGNAAEAINRIPSAALLTAPSTHYAMNRLSEMVSLAEPDGPAIYMAHRASFDRGFLEAFSPTLAARLPWICSKFDVPWPLSKPGASCVEMALAHGVPVVSAHRALTDCELIAKTLAAVAKTHDLAEILERAMRPKVRVVCTADTLTDVSLRETLKGHGFAWDRAKGEWWKNMTEAETAMLTFPVEVGS